MAHSVHAQQVIPLWADGAPGFEHQRNEPEQHKDWWYKNIHNPSLTVFLPPAGKSNGTAVVIAAGGGASNFRLPQTEMRSGDTPRDLRRRA